MNRRARLREDSRRDHSTTVSANPFKGDALQNPLPPDQPRARSVSELTAEIRGALETEFPDVWVAGELSNVRLYSSGHLYFRLSDDNATLKAVMFRPGPRRLDFTPEDGQAVVAHGRISVYAPRGDYQIIVDGLILQGLGALMKAYEELKARLAAEGLFSAEHKRPPPRLPRRVGIVTSRDGAALRDILNVLERRHAGLDILLRHSTVQGARAGEELARAVETLASSGLVDVLIVGRGGGSYEDLFCFNSEALARAVHACPVPVISAVGHEVDVTICDLVADIRAPTPSAAAELVTAERAELGRRVVRAGETMRRTARNRLSLDAQRLENLRQFLAPERLLDRLNTLRQRIDLDEERLRSLTRDGLNQLRRRLDTARAPLARMRGAPRLQQLRLDRRRAALELAARDSLARQHQRLGELGGRLAALEPNAVIARGYGHLSDDNGPVTTAADLEPGAVLRIELHDGGLDTLVRRKLERGTADPGPEPDQLRRSPRTPRERRGRTGKGRVPPEQTDLPL